jgi:hypothetical protein
VLLQMQELGYIKPAERAAADAEPVLSAGAGCRW